MSASPIISANDLRSLAERADSHRGVITYLVRNPEGAKEPYDIVDTPGNREILIRLGTDDDPAFVERNYPFRLESTPAVRMVAFPDKGIEFADAVFTSLVAMDKFVVPYYARHSTPEEIKAMRDRFAKDPSVLAVCHIPDSIETELKSDADLYAVVRAEDQEEHPGVVPLPLKAFVQTPFM